MSSAVRLAGNLDRNVAACVAGAHLATLMPRFICIAAAAFALLADSMIRRVETDDRERLRDVRLCALAGDPDAFHPRPA